MEDPFSSGRESKHASFLMCFRVQLQLRMGNLVIINIRALLLKVETEPAMENYLFFVRSMALERIPSVHEDQPMPYC